ncbi:serine O-acetyltransferase [Jeotgalibacillus proteolyticus]|uniref:Uncharacterized protein n=1 Tax=Jeotgalibacillus proteolyticus TaxID=2082395 RepID=A0A2S5G945_9BACL|nr:hypothetical protein [Jeotgalibacillus proteolyticus]PPA69499.1 hypothetical protein C4B60_13175 [Jeotgalibacillus proteolyticus]
MRELLKVLLPFIGRCEKLRFLIYLQSSAANKRLYIFMKIINTVIYKNFNCDISPFANIGRKTSFPHPIGIVIGEGVNIGNHVTIYQNVTIGREESHVVAYPTIEDYSILYANSIVIGDTVVKKGTNVGAYSLVNKSTVEDSLYVGIPAKFIREIKKGNK